MKVHLKRNMQWNNRGTVYSIPKQQHGTANMKGRENLILRADQREVEKLEKRDRYKKEIDLLDPDYLPSIVSGRRDMNQGTVRVGHGKRNPNSNRKR
jgi:RNA-binding protein NOB1